MRILVVEDESLLAQGLRAGLVADGFAVDVAQTGVDGLWLAREEPFDAIVLDLMLPGITGYELCRTLRAENIWTPILVLTANEGERAEVAGLDAGADDYLTKPFSHAVLVARLRALLRRTTLGGDGGNRGEVLQYADLVMDVDAHEVRRGATPITLTRTEFSLLELLLRNPRRVLERAVILDAVWGYDFPTTANSLEVYVGYLRRKTEMDDLPRLIHTVRGIGYVLRDTPP